MKIIKTLNNKIASNENLGVVEDNHGNKLQVKIDESKYGEVVRLYNSNGSVAGGGWAVDTLKNHKADAIYLDMGQNWYVTGMQNITDKLKNMDSIQENRRSIKVTFENGDSITTEINGSEEEINNYYLNKTFNLGPMGSSEDKMTKAINVEFLNN